MEALVAETELVEAGAEIVDVEMEEAEANCERSACLALGPGWMREVVFFGMYSTCMFVNVTSLCPR